jgi:hypothetical protein
MLVSAVVGSCSLCGDRLKPGRYEAWSHRAAELLVLRLDHAQAQPMCKAS